MGIRPCLRIHSLGIHRRYAGSCGGAVSLGRVVGAALDGMGKMVGALAVLVLAWSLASAIDELQAGLYLKELIDGSIPVVLFPTLVFIVSAATAFATGTSFGTMGILVLTVVFLSFSMSEDPVLHYAASGAVLSAPAGVTTALRFRTPRFSPVWEPAAITSTM